VGNPVHAGPLRLVSRGGVAAVSISGGSDRDGDREAVTAERRPQVFLREAGATDPLARTGR
jgi:hypothetical protein